LCVSQVKEKLKSNPELIVNILEKLGCHKIGTNYKNEIRAALPDGITDTSIRIKLDDILSCTIFSRSDFDGMDIISLVEYLKKTKFVTLYSGYVES
jgi:hypothetical protein